MDGRLWNNTLLCVLWSGEILFTYGSLNVRFSFRHLDAGTD